MNPLGFHRSFRLLAIGIASLSLVAIGCNSDTDDGAGTPSGTSGSTRTPGNGGTQTPQTDSPALRTVLNFQAAVLDLDLPAAMDYVQEGTDAYTSVEDAVVTLQGATNPNLPDETRQMIVGIVTGAWRGAEAEIVLEEGNSAIVSVTKSNGEQVDVNLNLFEGNWLIVGPRDAVLLR
jgi:hypothetical protein